MNHDRVHFAYNGIDVDPETQALTRNRLHWILDRLPSGRILDLGCSQGTLSILAAGRGDRVTGVDVEEEAVAFAAGQAAELPADVAARLAFLRGDGERLGLADGSFDAAVAGELLEHVADPGAVLTELHRVLAPGGTLLVSVPYGLMPHHDHRRTFYRTGFHRLLGPLFEIHELAMLERHIAAVAVRRDSPCGAPAFALSPEEEDFLGREERLEHRLHDLREKLSRANQLYREVTAANTELKAGLGDGDAGPVLQQLAALQETVQRLSASVSASVTGGAAAERDELRERLRTLGEERDRLNAGLRTAQSELGLLRDAAQAGETERDRLLESVHGLTSGLEALRETADAVTAQRDELRAHVRAQAEELRTIEAGHGQAMRDAEAAHARDLRELRERLTEAEKELATDQAALARLRTVYNGERHRHSLTEHRLNKLVALETKLTQENEKLRAKLETVSGRLTDYRDQVTRIRSSKAWRVLSVYRQLRHPGRPDPVRLAAPKPAPAVISPVTTVVKKTPAPAVAPRPAKQAPVPLADFRARLTEWIEQAKAAPGEEVVLMFSGTTFVQEARGNRPIRLTRVYLDRQCPVFFNYYRWRDTDPLPEHPDPLLYQSPIDVTPHLLDEVLAADFGGKRKLLFASFPHEAMVRTLTHAATHGWVTIYDARDDWEEFAKIGMAKWYHPGYERYVVAHADVVTAVSAPLARKMETLGGRRVVVNANALDPAFPAPPAPRRDDATTIGYFGHLTDKWFDWDLLIRAARTHPQLTFELAGHQHPADLKLPDNVRLLGLLGHRELAELSTGWALALIPFKNGALADAVDPIKVYEYLHLGLPVLTTYFPQCAGYPGVRVTESAAEFVAAIPEVAGSVLGPEVRSWLADNTWECRVEAYSEMAERIARKGREGLMTLLECR